MGRNCNSRYDCVIFITPYIQYHRVYDKYLFKTTNLVSTYTVTK